MGLTLYMGMRREILGWEAVGLASYLLIHFWFIQLQADRLSKEFFFKLL